MSESNNLELSTKYQVDLNLADKNDARIIALGLIEPGAKVLDVGCACGDFGALMYKEKNCSVYGMDYDSESLKIAEQYDIYHQLHQVDLNSFEPTKYPEYYASFDCIVLLDILEHLVNPETVLLKIKHYLKADGYFIVSLPNIAFCNVKIALLCDDFTYADTGVMDRTHLRFFTHRTIVEFMSRLKLKITECSITIKDCLPTFKIPFYVKRFIRKDPHSFAYQYIMKVEASELLAQEILKEQNTEQMLLDEKRINTHLRQMRRRRWMQKFFPVDSTQYTMAKSFKNFFMGTI